MGDQVVIEIDTLLAEATEEPPCGPDLEYDAAYLELDQAARGKPEQQFGDTVIPAEEPAWGQVLNGASDLLKRSKDLRVAALLTRALVQTEGFAGLPSGLKLIHQLVERYWDGLHPRLDADDNNDPTMRMNALAPLVDADALLRDLRNAFFVRSRQHGQIRVREIEAALGKLPARADDQNLSQAQIDSLLRAAHAEDGAALAAVGECLTLIRTLGDALTEKVGASSAPDFKPLVAVIHSLEQVAKPILDSQSVAAEGAAEAAGESGGEAGAPKAISGEIRSRQDANMMIEKIIQYLERAEPTNPAPLMLRRAQRLMSMNFVDIIRDLVPDGLTQVEHIAGLDREQS